MFIVALGVTGSFGFQRSSVEGPLFGIFVFVGLASPVVAACYLIWQIIASALELSGLRSPMRLAPQATQHGTIVTQTPPSPDGPAGPVSTLPRRNEGLTILALAFVLIAGFYLWGAGDPVARSQAHWGDFVRDALLGSVIVWFVKPWVDEQRGRETTRRDRWYAAIGGGGLIALSDVALPLLLRF